jgi:membrane-associated phospholipid phosphatase
MDFIQNISIQIIQAVQTLCPVLDDLAKFFSSLGALGFFVLLISSVYWMVNIRLGKTALFALILTSFIGLALTQLLRQPRPYWLGEVLPLATETTYGNPASHASASMAVLGYLAYRFNKEWLWAAAGLGVVLIAFSRLYLGVQFPLDILCGWLIGVTVISVLIWSESKSFTWWSRRSIAGQIGISFGISMLMILVGVGIGRLIANSPDQLSWAGHATQARSLVEYFSIAGAFFGAACGWSLTKKKLDLKITAPYMTNLSRWVLGFIGLTLIYFSLGWVMGKLVAPGTTPAFVLRYIQMTLITFWIMFIAPWLFVKLKLAKPVIPLALSP